MLLKYDSLTPAALHVIKNKGTEPPFSGVYTDLNEHGSYLCRLCGLSLFRANAKFHSGCGWPSFDVEVADHVTRLPDQDGQRIEIICKRCHAHLGHVFTGEQFTAKNTRYCVNSLSLDFVKDTAVLDSHEAIFAAGCFWGVEYYFKKLPGVLKTEVGYTGGKLAQPSYEAVCRKDSGHVEAIRVVFDPQKINYAQLCQYFFEIHDPGQQDGQGPDLGPQYLSRIFYYDASQLKIAEQIIQLLRAQSVFVATQLLPVQIFWAAEMYHQDYYTKTGKVPYCHRYVKKFY